MFLSSLLVLLIFLYLLGIISVYSQFLAVSCCESDKSAFTVLETILYPHRHYYYPSGKKVQNDYREFIGMLLLFQVIIHL